MSPDDDDFLRRFERDLAAARTAGRRAISVDALQAYVEAGRSDAASVVGLAAPAESARGQLLLAHKDAEISLSVASFQATVDAGREALKAAVLINGGGAVALLSFLGTAISRGFPGQLGLALTLPLAGFASGVLLAAVGFGLRYGAQVQYRLQHHRAGNAFNRSAVAAGILAYLAFGLGVLTLFLSFRTQFAG